MSIEFTAEVVAFIEYWFDGELEHRAEVLNSKLDLGNFMALRAPEWVDDDCGTQEISFVDCLAWLKKARPNAGLQVGAALAYLKELKHFAAPRAEDARSRGVVRCIVHWG